MDIWDEIKKLSGYQSGNGGVDSYGVDHSGFSTRDELEYQSARLARENQLAENFSKQGIAEENYPQFGTNFWGGTPENNYGFGTSNIKQNIENITNQLNNGGFSGGMNIVGNFSDMRKMNVTDKYKHAMMNCSAAQYGQGGADMATLASNLREWNDKRTGSNTLDSSEGDQYANRIGRLLGGKYPKEDCDELIRRYIKKNW